MQNEKLKELIAIELHSQQIIGIKQVLDNYSFEGESGLFYSWEKINNIEIRNVLPYDDLTQERQQYYLDIAEKLLTEALNE